MNYFSLAEKQQTNKLTTTRLSKQTNKSNKQRKAKVCYYIIYYYYYYYVDDENGRGTKGEGGGKWSMERNQGSQGKKGIGQNDNLLFFL